MGMMHQLDLLMAFDTIGCGILSTGLEWDVMWCKGLPSSSVDGLVSVEEKEEIKATYFIYELSHDSNRSCPVWHLHESARWGYPCFSWLGISTFMMPTFTSQPHAVQLKLLMYWPSIWRLLGTRWKGTDFGWTLTRLNGYGCLALLVRDIFIILWLGCDVVYMGLPLKTIQKLQLIQNATGKQ